MSRISPEISPASLLLGPVSLFGPVFFLLSRLSRCLLSFLSQMINTATGAPRVYCLPAAATYGSLFPRSLFRHIALSLSFSFSFRSTCSTYIFSSSSTFRRVLRLRTTSANARGRGDATVALRHSELRSRGHA